MKKTINLSLVSTLLMCIAVGITCMLGARYLKNYCRTLLIEKPNAVSTAPELAEEVAKQ